MAGGATEQLPARGSRHNSAQREADLKSGHKHAVKESGSVPRGGSNRELDGKPDSTVADVQPSLTGEHLSSQRELSAIAECVSPVTTPGTQKGETSPRGSSAASPRDSGNHSLTGEDHSETTDAPALEEAETEVTEQESKDSVPEQSFAAGSDVTEPTEIYHQEVPDKDQLVPVEADPEAARVQEAPEEEMSGNMQIMRPAEALEDVTAAHHDTRSLSLEHVIVGKLEGEPQIEKDSNAIKAENAESAMPTEILAKDINSYQENEEDKKDDKHEKPPVPETKPKKNDVKQGSRVASETARSKKTSRAGTAQDARVSKPPPSDRSRAESKTLKKQESTRSLKKPTQIKQKPRSSSQEDLRPPLKHRHSTHLSNQQGPPEKGGLLQKSSSLANIPRNSSAMVSANAGKGACVVSVRQCWSLIFSWKERIQIRRLLNLVYRLRAYFVTFQGMSSLEIRFGCLCVMCFSKVALGRNEPNFFQKPTTFWLSSGPQCSAGGKYQLWGPRSSQGPQVG